MRFVIGRTYFLKVDGIATSRSIKPLSSVPQVYHFGPVLYIIFTNDMELGELQYADDTKLYMVINNMADRNRLQNKVDQLVTWSESNGLTLNAAKTFHMSYGKKIISSIYFIGHQIIQESNILSRAFNKI